MNDGVSGDFVGVLFMLALVSASTLMAWERHERISRGLLWMFLGPSVLIMFVMALNGRAAAIAGLALVCLVLLGGPIARVIVVPLGLPRLASAVAVVGGLLLHVDARGLGILTATRACLWMRHRGRVSFGHALEWIEQRVLETRVVRPASVVAKGLCCVLRGDDEQARVLLKSIGDFAAPLRGGPTHVVAARWLVADAASRGDWAALQRLPRRLNTTLTCFAAGCAARIKGAPVLPTKGQLIEMWAYTSSRLASFPLLRMALSHVSRAESSRGEPLLARHVAALRGEATPQAILELATSWEQQLASVPDSVRPMVLADLASMADKEPSLKGQHAYFARESADTIGALELAIEALQRRLSEERRLRPIDEWTELAMIRELYDSVIVDAERRRYAFDVVRETITNHAVDLFNHREQRPIGNALFTWMWCEAQAVREYGLVQVYARNRTAGFG